MGKGSKVVPEQKIDSRDNFINQKIQKEELSGIGVNTFDFIKRWFYDKESARVKFGKEYDQKRKMKELEEKNKLLNEEIEEQKKKYQNIIDDKNDNFSKLQKDQKFYIQAITKVPLFKDLNKEQIQKLLHNNDLQQQYNILQEMSLILKAESQKLNLKNLEQKLRIKELTDHFKEVDQVQQDLKNENNQLKEQNQQLQSHYTKQKSSISLK